MEIGIVGLSQSGKTTLFNALTRGHAAAAAAHGARAHIGVAKVPDARLDRLCELFHPKKTTPVEMVYVDTPGAPEALGKGEGIAGEFLNHLQRSEALLYVVRAFDDPAVPHTQGSVDPYRDIATLDAELAFADLLILEKRVQRLEVDLRKARAQDREALHREQALLGRIKDRLESDAPLRDQGLTPDERRSIEHYQFLTAKPLLVVLSTDEEKLPALAQLSQELAARLHGPSVGGAVVFGKLEADLAQMAPAEEEEFRATLGAGAPALALIAALAQKVLGRIVFYTVGDDECKAYDIPLGTPALKAARKIHTDMERGFIRAEVIPAGDLVACGGFPEARKKGLLRTEGKTYEVLDGEIVHFLFSV